MVTAWDTARQRWAGDPHGETDDLLPAARRTDAAARRPRQHAGELTDARRFPLAGDAGGIEFAVGDLVRITRNDYRSQRSNEPDVFNGFRGVVLRPGAGELVGVEAACSSRVRPTVKLVTE
ncbi:hypothetical protein [Streptomyces hygroscopicus]|uniref:hypothetical protein n=1 Tax=Streptomyces hygroscopicus TaxID=1912 RepID=UPI0008315D61|nr:hypothetical protein [Streptomyces hygroscopicus]GLV76317.1 hypothetical protein Shyhy02_43170 [Streptomyces hygroscopicus subsp. hygroscopicus]